MKKVLCAFLSLAMITAVFAGCTPKPSTTQSSSNATATSSISATEWGKDTKEYTLQEQLFAKKSGISGKVVVFLPWQVDTYWTTLKTEFEKEYAGTTVEYVSTAWSTRDVKLASFIASGNSPDIASTTYGDFPMRSIANMLQPIDDKIAFNNPTLDQYMMKNITSWKGKMYAMIFKKPAQVIYYNTSLFSQAGAKTPLEYYNEGNWTWTTLQELARKMTYGTGDSKVWGFGIDQEFMFGLSAKADIIKETNEVPVLNIDDANFRKGMNTFVTMLSIDKSVYPNKWLSFRDGFCAGKVAMTYWSMGDAKYLVETSKLTDYDIVPFPKAPGAEKYIGLATGDGFGVPVGAKNSDAGIAFAEFFGNYESKIAKSPLKKSYFTAEQEKRAKDVELVSTRIYGYNLESQFSQGLCNDLRNGGSFSTLLEQYRPKMQKAIDDVLNAK